MSRISWAFAVTKGKPLPACSPCESRLAASSLPSPANRERWLSNGGVARSSAWKTLAKYFVSASRYLRPRSLSVGRDNTCFAWSF